MPPKLTLWNKVVHRDECRVEVPLLLTIWFAICIGADLRCQKITRDCWMMSNPGMVKKNLLLGTITKTTKAKMLMPNIHYKDVKYNADTKSAGHH
jgi:hypothetical protein